ncbi:MAG: ABC transporter permease [Thiogranum sp.]|nr:ABC transporter permease [Thiogranum sp.]
MIRNIALLTFNDLAMALKNKTLYLVLFIPLFVFLTLELVDNNGTDVQQIKIGLIEGGDYPAGLLESIEAAEGAFAVFWFGSEEQGARWLKERNGDGVLVPTKESGGSLLVVLEKASFETLVIVESIAELQRAVEDRSNWISEIHPLQDAEIQRQMLPTWILMLVLLVGFIVLPTQVAEEKEKKLLLGLLQTPIREAEWLLAKIALGTVLIAVAALLLHLLMGIDSEPGGRLSYVAFLLAGGFCFSAFGIFVGFLCRTQASARTLGVLFYLPHLLPSALADFSEKLSSVAPLIPSYQFYQPVRVILLDGGEVADFPLQLLALVGVGLLASFLSWWLMKRRWLM